MKLLRLYAEDLFSYETLDLELSNLGLVLVDGENMDLGGSNGAGKSSIFKILQWVLFGRTSDGIRGDEVIREVDHEPVTGKSYGYVCFDLDGRVIEVFRYRKHTVEKNKMILLRDDEDISKGSDRETQAVLQDLLQLDLDIFTSAVMFPQGSSGFASRGDSDQKSILDGLLGTDRFDAARIVAKDRFKVSESQLLKVEGNINVINGQLQTLQQSLDATYAQSDSWETKRTADLAALNTMIAEKQRALEEPSPEASTEYENIQQQLSQFPEHLLENKTKAESEWHRLLRSISSLEGEIKVLSAATAVRAPQCEKPVPSLEKLQEREQQVITDIRNLDSDFALSMHSKDAASKAVLSIRAKLVEADVSTHCDKCGQPLNTDAIEHAKKQLQEELEKQELLEKQHSSNQEHSRYERNKVVDRHSELQSQIAAAREWQAYEKTISEWQDPAPLQEEKDRLQSQADVYAAEISNYSSQLTAKEQLQNRLSELGEAVQQYRQRQQLNQTALENAQLQYKQLQLSQNPFDASIQSTLQQKQAKERDKDLQQKLRDRYGIECDMLQFWIDGFGNQGLKSLIFDHSLPILTATANTYLEVLTNGTAELDISAVKTLSSGESRDKLTVSAKYKNGGGSYSKVSGGEKRRIDLALLFALGELAACQARSPIELRLLDEPFDDLDAIGSEQVIDLLNQFIVPAAGTVLVMSHNDALKSLIPNRITVVKEHGVSRIERS